MSEIPFPEANPVETCVCWCLPQFDRQRTTIVRNTSNATKLRTLELGRWALECSSLAQPLSVTHDVARGTPTSYFEHKSQNTHQRTLHRSKNKSTPVTKKSNLLRACSHLGHKIIDTHLRPRTRAPCFWKSTLGKQRTSSRHASDLLLTHPLRNCL